MTKEELLETIEFISYKKFYGLLPMVLGHETKATLARENAEKLIEELKQYDLNIKEKACLTQS